jgi:hypothetical protein
MRPTGTFTNQIVFYHHTKPLIIALTTITEAVSKTQTKLFYYIRWKCNEHESWEDCLKTHRKGEAMKHFKKCCEASKYLNIEKICKKSE